MSRLAQRLAKPLTLLVIAAQLLLAVPAMAGASFAAPAAAEIPCDDMPMHAGDDPCPCCPDGSGSMTDCLVSCLLSAVAAPSICLASVQADSTEVFVNLPVAAPAPNDPPLKPPPIA